MRRVRVAKAARAHAVRDCLSDRSSRRCALGHLGPFALGGPEPEAVPAPPPPLPEPVPRRRWTRFAPGQMRHLQGGADARRDHCAGQPRPAEFDLSRNTVRNLRGPTWRTRRHQRSCSAAPATSTSPTYARRRPLPNRSSTRTTSSPTTSCRVRNLRWSSAPLRGQSPPIRSRPSPGTTRWRRRRSRRSSGPRSAVARGCPARSGQRTSKARNGWPSRRLMPRRTSISARFITKHVDMPDGAVDGDPRLALFGPVDRVVRAISAREVRALTGFSRIAPSGPVVPPDLGRGLDWLPAPEVYGEGVFLAFDEEEVRRWEHGPAADRVRVLQIVATRPSSDNGCRTSARGSVLLHTLAHLPIRQLAFDSGYASRRSPNASTRGNRRTRLPGRPDPRSTRPPVTRRYLGRSRCARESRSGC